MALIILNDNTKRIVSAKQGAYIWRILNNEIEPNDQWAIYCSKIKGVYLNYDYAPERYRVTYPDRKPWQNEPFVVRRQEFVETRRDLV